MMYSTWQCSVFRYIDIFSLCWLYWLLSYLKVRVIWKRGCRSTHSRPTQHICRLAASEGSRRTSPPVVGSGANLCSKQPLPRSDYPCEQRVYTPMKEGATQGSAGGAIDRCQTSSQAGRVSVWTLAPLLFISHELCSEEIFLVNFKFSMACVHLACMWAGGSGWDSTLASITSYWDHIVMMWS